MERILVTFLSVGSGHQVAAECLTSVLSKISHVEVICKDLILDRSRHVVHLFNTANSISPSLFPRLYNQVWSSGRAGPVLKWIARDSWLAHHFQSVANTVQPRRIVCTHALPALMASYYAERSIPSYKTYGVITDFGVHAYWPHPLVNHYCVPAEDTKTDLVAKGIKPQLITVTGMPIRPNVARNPTDMVRSSRQLNVLFVLGGVRPGPYSRAVCHVVSALRELNSYELPVSITVIAGKNRSVYDHLRKVPIRMHNSMEIHGLVNDLPIRLAQADIVVSKPGGVITAEVLAAGTPFVAITPGPGQETANAMFLKRNGLAIISEHPHDLIHALNRLVFDESMRKRLKNAATRYGRPHAAVDAARVILNT